MRSFATSFDVVVPITMHVSHLLSLVAALPLATAVVPPYPRHVPHGALGKWIDFKQNSQFDFQPFSLTKLGLECDRKSGNDTFDCELSCKSPLTSFAIYNPASTNKRIQSTGTIPTQSDRTMSHPAPAPRNGPGTARRVAVARTPPPPSTLFAVMTTRTTSRCGSYLSALLRTSPCPWPTTTRIPSTLDPSLCPA